MCMYQRKGSIVVMMIGIMFLLAISMFGFFYWKSNFSSVESQQKLALVKQPRFGDWSSLPNELSFFKNLQTPGIPRIPTGSTLLVRVNSADEKLLNDQSISYVILPNTDEEYFKFSDIYNSTRKVGDFLSNFPPHTFRPGLTGNFPPRIDFGLGKNSRQAGDTLIDKVEKLTSSERAELKGITYYDTDGPGTNAYLAVKIPLDINRNQLKDDYIIWSASCGLTTSGRYVNSLPTNLGNLDAELENLMMSSESLDHTSEQYLYKCALDFPLTNSYQ